MPSGAGTNRRQGVFRYTSYEGAGYGFCTRFLPTMVVVAGLSIVPGVHAEYWHGHGHPKHHGDNAGAAVVGGLIGLGIGAAIASGGYYAPPPPVYYGAPPGYYCY